GAVRCTASEAEWVNWERACAVEQASGATKSGADSNIAKRPFGGAAEHTIVARVEEIATSCSIAARTRASDVSPRQRATACSPSVRVREPWVGYERSTQARASVR